VRRRRAARLESLIPPFIGEVVASAFTKIAIDPDDKCRSWRSGTAVERPVKVLSVLSDVLSSGRGRGQAYRAFAFI
jgi:hypothetical protein